MTLKIYNTLSRKKEKFTPVEKGKVKMYVCGMTVYSDAHIGHARTYFAFDVVRRYFEYKGYKVTYVQNITDVDDKIIKAANKEGADTLEYSRRFTDRCLGDLNDLGIRKADIYPKASETIPDMIKMIQRIIDNGYGYTSKGDVYFSLEKFKEYGQLSGQRIDEMKIGARIIPGEKKRSPLDFALWKKAKDGEPFWESPWGNGRPGWHIECSTMSSKYLGFPFDIHGGGMDLRFPHHENEIAQAEAASGKQFVKYWMHVGLLSVDGEKMSKSIGNIINVKDLLKNWDPEVVRFFFVQTQYRSPPDFTEEALRKAKRGLERIHRLKDRLGVYLKDGNIKTLDEGVLTDEEKNYLKIVNSFKEGFERAMDDDFNTPGAVASVFDFVNQSNRFLESVTSPNRELCSYAADTLIMLGGILTLFQPKIVSDDASSVIKGLNAIVSRYGGKVDKTELEELMKGILKVREAARKDKDWSTADNIRKDLEDLGFEIQDTDEGPVWRKK